MNSNNYPLVSVIIPTYKRPDNLDRAINSVLSQTYQNVEIIVVDDNSPDTEGRKLTEVKMAAYADNSRIKYVKHEHNKNGSAARNTGARLAQGVYLAFLDDDDEFLPCKIKNQVERLLSLPPDYAVCYTRSYLQKPGVEPFLSKEEREGDLYFEALTRELSFQAGSNLFVRKDAFDSIGGFDETFTRNQDKEITTRLLKKYKIAFCHEPGLIVHLHFEHSFFDPLEVSRHYVARFAKDIDELPNEKKNVFYSILAKQSFYYHLRFNKDYKSCIKMILKREIRIKDVISLMNSLVFNKKKP